MNLGEFYKGKKVLVTGADGFMGSHLTEELLKLGAEVSAYVRGNSVTGTVKNELRNIIHIKDKLKEIITGDIGSSDSIDLIKKNNPQIIFHLAADAYVPNSFKHPMEVMKTNLLGTLHILHAVMDSKEVEQCVCTSSSEVYGTHSDPIKETDEFEPSTPYGASKAAADRYCYAYWKTYNVPVAIIRPFNTYGPRMIYDVTPKFIEMALNNKDITVHGSGKQTRDFNYVDDTIKGFLLMGSHKKAIGQSVNFGSGIDISINELAEKIIKYTNSNSKLLHTEERQGQVMRLCCDNTKAKKMFEWEPKIPIDEGLKKNIGWFKEVIWKE